MKLESYDDLPQIRKKHQGEKIVFCSGAFDLLHAGHILFFEDCKKQGDVLVVTVGNDEMIRKNKGAGRPIFNEAMRIKMVDALKSVDYTLLEKSMEHPLGHVSLALAKLQPDTYVVNDDGFDMPYRVETARQYGASLVVLPRTCPPEFEGVSTSATVKKIKALS